MQVGTAYDPLPGLLQGVETALQDRCSNIIGRFDDVKKMVASYQDPATSPIPPMGNLDSAKALYDRYLLDGNDMVSMTQTKNL